tara:strand:+ start:4525 stop:6816 length:2292 start_codon:yes stop_codon:yes gene_type:complete
MEKIKPKVYAHGSYIGTGGYNNHTRDFFRKLSELCKIKFRNFNVSDNWKGNSDTQHDGEKYINDLDKKLLIEQTLWGGKNGSELVTYPIYKKYPNNFEHNINLILAEVNHHFYYHDYKGLKIGYVVWETTKYPEQYFNKLKTFDQIWVASKWQRDCTIEQGADPNKVKVIPEAVDSNVFHPDKKSTLPEYDDGRFKFIHFGRWDYRKSTKEIIETFLKTFSPDEPIDLILSIDNGMTKDNFKTTEERLKHYNLVDSRLKIKHFPTREEYIKYIKKGHVFVSCARSEGWNLPLIEAMACGTPSIYSNCSGQLEFAEDKGLPVKIKDIIPAIGGEYSFYSQSDLSGEFYQPDFDDLKKVMRDAYVNYKKYKKRALKESIQIREKFTWENAAKIANKELDSIINNQPLNKIEISFQSGPKVEILGNREQEYFIEFINSDTNEVIHQSTINNNMWTSCSKEYYIPWIIKIDGKIVHTYNLKDKIVKVTIDSKSVGDTLAWVPQVIEFQKKYKCKIILSTFHNEWFKKLEAYKNIDFVAPGVSISSYSQYKIGWFKEDGKWDVGKKNKIQCNTIPLIQTATDILGLSYKEINHGIDFKLSKRPIKEQYICIGPQATAGLKEWPYQNWKNLAKILHSKGYKVVSLTLNGFKGTNIIDKSKLPWDKLFNYIYHADLFIGLGSGLSWVNWALNKHTVMINNFVPYGYDIPNNLTKIENHSVCNNCWTKEDYIFDPGNWNWCPVFQGTEKQHICQKSLTVEQVFNKVKKHLN